MSISYRSTIVALSLSLALMGSTCKQLSLSQPVRPPSSAEDWKALSPVIERRQLKVPHEGTQYELIAYRFPKNKVTAALIHKSQPLLLQEWFEAYPSNLMINGAYFTEDFLPTGSFIYEGSSIGVGSYDAQRSATVVIDNGELLLFDTAEESMPKKKFAYAFQTFPVLLHRSGKRGVDEDSEKLARRTVLAEDRNGNIVVIVVDRTPISLYTLALVLENTDLGLAVAVNLDGGPSTGLIADVGAFQEPILPLASLPIVLSFVERSLD